MLDPLIAVLVQVRARVVGSSTRSQRFGKLLSAGRTRRGEEKSEMALFRMQTAREEGTPCASEIGRR